VIFAELCCGSAAVSLALLQRGARPPVSYQGAKTGYAEPILAAFGLYPGQGCGGLYLADPGPWAAVWAGLAGSSLLQPSISPREVAGWLLGSRWSFSGRGPERGYGGPGCEVKTERASWTTEDRDRALSISNLQASLSALPLSGAKALASILEELERFQDQIDAGETPRQLWERIKKEGWPGLTGPARFLCGAGAGEVSRFLACMAMSMIKNGEMSGYSSVNGEGREFMTTTGERGLWLPSTPASVSKRVSALPVLPPLAIWQGSALQAPLPEDLSDWIVYLDPPYAGTSGYSHGGMTREELLSLARNLAGRGAVVGISEAVDLSESLPGWFCINLSHSRKGVKRAWSAQKEEYLTINRKPVVSPTLQATLF